MTKTLLDYDTCIRARAPLRIGLAGGGTDLTPYCEKFGGYVLNATINRYAYANLKKLREPLVRFISTDQQLEESYPLHDVNSQNSKLKIHMAIFNYMITEFNGGAPIPLELSTYCDAPIGSGLGASSTLVVAIIRGFVEMLNISLDEYAIAHLAYRIERIECGLQGGRQDQYSATFGGVNFMEFYEEDRVIVNTLRIKSSVLCELEASLILYFTGVSRESAKIIQTQARNLDAGSEAALNAMHVIKKEALTMKDCLLRSDFDGVIESMRLGWEGKKNTATLVTNAHINHIYSSAIKAGAAAGKVSGAGGGGFMMFYVAPNRRMDVIRNLKEFGGEVSNCHFTSKGAQAWII